MYGQVFILKGKIVIFFDILLAIVFDKKSLIYILKFQLDTNRLRGAAKLQISAHGKPESFPEIAGIQVGYIDISIQYLFYTFNINVQFIVFIGIDSFLTSCLAQLNLPDLGIAADFCDIDPNACLTTEPACSERTPGQGDQEFCSCSTLTIPEYSPVSVKYCRKINDIGKL